MPSLFLITGGAGFIGSHVADRLLTRGYRMRVLDALLPQVHGPDAVRPPCPDPHIELQVGDVRDAEAVRAALDGVDTVFPFAARVGVRQSMYRVPHDTDHNGHGTAVLMEAPMDHPVERLGFAKVRLKDGVTRRANSLATQCPDDRIVDAAEELRLRGLSA